MEHAARGGKVRKLAYKRTSILKSKLAPNDVKHGMLPPVFQNSYSKAPHSMLGISYFGSPTTLTKPQSTCEHWPGSQMYVEAQTNFSISRFGVWKKEGLIEIDGRTPILLDGKQQQMLWQCLLSPFLLCTSSSITWKRSWKEKLEMDFLTKLLLLLGLRKAKN